MPPDCHYACGVPPPSSDRFDADFYRRFYSDPRTRVVTRVEMARRADLVGAFVRHGELRVRSILDLGCGLGLMRETLQRHFPHASYTGVEASAYLCEKFGWVQGSAATFEARRPFDLVICYDVLQYLDSREAAAAIRNLGRLCAGVLHFGALTQEDWDLYCDQDTTDSEVHIREGNWYRRRLAPAFINAGSGMFVRRGTPFHLWELDQVEVLRSRRSD
ncbi:MAG: class I SAM-dependent methyltransferase [Steroidobacteraceae bacterium]